jgi:hypothetical protein
LLSPGGFTLDFITLFATSGAYRNSTARTQERGRLRFIAGDNMSE